jgi:meiotically up-regulated gene 157 (Mug157) protein
MLLEGALRSQAKYIAIDPYANAYGEDYRGPEKREFDDDRLLRGGYVRTANYEMDDGAYFLRFLKTYMEAVPGSTLLKEPQIHEAVTILLNLYQLEQNHNNSRYEYPTRPPWELPHGPRGSPVGYTGMVWNAFRPSDDAHTYGYHIPGNLFLATYLSFVSKTAREVWRDDQLGKEADKLQKDILNGVEKYGVTEVEGKKIYCYETDGLGNCNLMDDANVPSLLSIPYLDPSGAHYDSEIYKHTREFILSKQNPWFFEGTEARGIGSPHTGEHRIWPMSLIMEAFTTDSKQQRTALINTLIRTSKQDLLHESFHMNDHMEITRDWFAWPNALFAELVQSIGYPCGTLDNAPKFGPYASRSRAGPLLDLPGSQSFYTADVQALRYRSIPGLNLLAASTAKLTKRH